MPFDQQQEFKSRVRKRVVAVFGDYDFARFRNNALDELGPPAARPHTRFSGSWCIPEAPGLPVWAPNSERT